MKINDFLKICLSLVARVFPLTRFFGKPQNVPASCNTAQTWIMKRLVRMLPGCSSTMAQLQKDPILDHHWDPWKKTYGKQYKEKNEDIARCLIWDKNLKFVMLHNLEHSMGMHSYDLGMDHLAYLTCEEGKSLMGSLIVPRQWKRNVTNQTQIRNYLDSLDWRDKGYVTEVKFQLRPPLR